MRIPTGQGDRLKQVAARVAALAADWGRTYDVVLALPDVPRRPYPVLRDRTKPAGPQPTNTQVLGFLAAGGRDMLQVTPMVRSMAVAETLAALRVDVIPSPQVVRLVLANAYRRAVLYVAETGAGLKPNTPEWRARKQRLGLSTRPGRASSQLLDALKRSQIRIVPR